MSVDIVKVLQDAFLPYKCGAEIWDYNKRIKFAVYDDKNNKIFDIPDMLLSEINTESKLNFMINNCKKTIKKNGYEFNE